MDKKLTVVITTYNRKQPLIEQLQSLERQGLYDQYRIIVSNNCSDYDVEASLKEALSPEFMEIVTVYNRKYNVGGDCNIALSFQLVDTEWMWLLSDDDLTMPGSVKTVLDDVDNYPDVCWLKYSISGGFKLFDDKRCDNLVDVFETCMQKNGHGFGEFIFMANNVYHMPLIKKHIGDVLALAMTCIPHDIAPMFAVKYEHQPMMFRSAVLTNYVVGRVSYTPLYALSNFVNIFTTKFEFSPEEFDAYRLLSDQSSGLVYALFDIRNRKIRHQYFLKFMAGYRWKNPVYRFVSRLVYYPFHLANAERKTVEGFVKMFKKSKKSETEN